MSDDVKAAVARFRATIADERARMDDGAFNALWGDDALVLAYIDGEKERTLKALEAAELRAASVERRKVVKFLRRYEATIGEASDAIERGDHLGGWTHD